MHYKIYQQNNLISGRAEPYTSFWQKLRGFMFDFSNSKKTIFFRKVKIIHNFFVFKNLAVIVLNKSSRIIAKFILQPFRVSSYYPQAEYLIESTDLRIYRKTAINKKLKFIPITKH